MILWDDVVVVARMGVWKWFLWCIKMVLEWKKWFWNHCDAVYVLLWCLLSYYHIIMFIFLSITPHLTLLFIGRLRCHIRSTTCYSNVWPFRPHIRPIHFTQTTSHSPNRPWIQPHSHNKNTSCRCPRIITLCIWYRDWQRIAYEGKAL